MKKEFLVWAAVLFLGISFSQAFAEELSKEDAAELGITTNGGASVAETLAKVKSKTDKYENAKEKVAQIFTGAPKNAEEAKTGSKKSAETKAAPKKVKEVPVIKREPLKGEWTTFHLKNGQIFSAVITEKDKNGYWVEMEQGLKMYITNAEIKKSYPRPE